MSHEYPEAAQAIFSRLDGEAQARAAGRRARCDQVQEARARCAAAREERDRLADADRDGRLYREETDGNGGTKRNPSPELKKAEAELSRAEKRLEQLSSMVEEPAMTVARLNSLVPRGVPLVESSVRVKVPKGESKRAALKRVREQIVVAKAERSAVLKAAMTLKEARAAAKSQIAALAAGPQTMALFYGGSLEMPEALLPDGSPVKHYVANGVALVAWLFQDELLRRVDELLEFNDDPEAAISQADKDRRVAAIDTQLEQLGREEAALVEAIVADGGAAYHRPDANPLHVLGLAVA